MMSAARSAGFRYKKRAPSQPKTQKKCRHNGGSCCPISSQITLSSGNSPQINLGSDNSLTVPNNLGLRKRSGSVPALKINSLANIWNLKYEQVRALRMTWARLCEPPRSNCKGIVNLVERVWEKMDSKDPSVRTIFYNAAFVETMNDRCERRRSKGSIATIRDHTHFFVSLVSQVVQNLDLDPKDILDHIDVIGREHAYLKQYGFKSSHWEKVGEYFVDIVVIQDCVRGFPEACRAWTILVAAIVDRLRAAPRRGSVASSLSSINRITGSTHNMNTIGMRRCSIASAQNSSQGSVSGSMGSLTGNSPKKNHSNCSSSTDLRDEFFSLPRRPSLIASCLDLTPLEHSLPDNRTSNPAIA